MFGIWLKLILVVTVNISFFNQEGHQFFLLHVKLLCSLPDTCQEVSVNKCVKVIRLVLKQSVLLAFLLQRRQQSDAIIWIIHDPVDCGRSGICSVLTDGRDYLMGQPPLECLCLLLAGSENQGIKSRLADHKHLLITARGAD